MQLFITAYQKPRKPPQLIDGDIRGKQSKNAKHFGLV